MYSSMRSGFLSYAGGAFGALYNPNVEASTASKDPLTGLGRILALDVGKKRIGLAVSDLLGITAQGLPTLHRGRIRDDLDALRELAGEREVKLLLIGRPLHMSGDESRQSSYTDEFAARLSKHLELPVTFWDERLTSAEAERRLRLDGTSTGRQTGNVDRLAATLLLESYLAFQEAQAADLEILEAAGEDEHLRD